VTQLRAVLFDIDGTLVDSNFLHVDAWDRGLADAGIPADAWRIHRAIGMDSSKLLDAVAAGAPEEATKRAKELHSEYYKQSADRLRHFESAPDLLRELDGRGLRIVLATSAPEDELEILRGVLDVEDALDVVTSAGDVETAKPEPDILEVALSRAEAEPGEALLVGDTVWDVAAAKAAGVDTIGVLSGGVSAAELTEAGAVEVYEDVAELLRRLDESVIGQRLRKP
jgi:HAD superfamily hydrolase (TIGR01509 family)